MLADAPAPFDAEDTAPTPSIAPPANLLPDAKVLAFPGITLRTDPDAAAPPASTDENDDDVVTATDVDDLFARLRSQQVAPAGPDSETPPEPTAFERRDEALTPLIVASARKLKRVLADEQNAVLDRLRRPEAVRTIDDVLADPDSQSATYFGAIVAEVLAAAEVGADSMGGAMLDVSSLPSGGHGVLAPVEESLREELVAPLRKRLAGRIANDDGDNEAITKSVRAVYREWKTKHIDNHLDDLLRLAHGRGVFAALTPGEPCRWTVDPSGGACSDCDDNSLQGAVAAGSAFPTGHLAAPAHPGCRCLLARADG